MGQKVNPNMWCPRCQRHVLGVRQTHRARRGLLALTTGGLSLAAGHFWYCPNCGGKVRYARGDDG